jgi:secondary thiamine-phosphate synthase enzyme
MSVYHQAFRVQSQRVPTFHDVTEQAREALSLSGVKNGILVVFSQHTTCSVIIQEESHDVNYWGTEFIMQDLVNALDKIIPDCKTENGKYLHPGPKHIEVAVGNNEQPSWSLNTDGHIRSIVLGRSESIPVIDGQLELGEFGRIYLADFDQVRARERIVRVQIVGE